MHVPGQRPQVWTSETTVVRALAALAICHAKEFGRSLSEITGLPLTGVLPGSVRREDHRTDLLLRTEAGRSVFLEAKIDDFVSVEQIDKYTAELPQSYGVLLVPDATARDVVSVVEQRPELRVVCWKDLLASLALVNPIACQLEEDINRMSSLPDSKARARHMMHRALEVIGRSAPGTDQVDFELTYAQSRYPSLDLQVANTWVFGQVEPARTKGRELKFTAKVGFRTDGSDQRDAGSIERMQRALHRAWEEAERVEAGNHAVLSRDRHASKHQQVFGTEHPFQARGYRNSHVGVATVGSADVMEVTAWAQALARAFAPVSREIWGSPPAS